MVDDVFVGEVTQPETLRGLCDRIDVVFSSIGITRQTGKASYMDVDYQGNRNLLDLARAASVRKFIYVHAFNARLLQFLEGMQAKLQEANRNLATLSARMRAADFKKKMATNEPSSIDTSADNAFAKFERMREKVERAEAEAEALNELRGSPVSKPSSRSEEVKFDDGADEV